MVTLTSLVFVSFSFKTLNCWTVDIMGITDVARKKYFQCSHMQTHNVEVYPDNLCQGKKAYLSVGTVITLFSLRARSYLVLCLLLFSIHTAKAGVWALITLTASKSPSLASTRAANICSQCCCRDGFDLSLWQRHPQCCIPTRLLLLHCISH